MFFEYLIVHIKEAPYKTSSSITEIVSYYGIRSTRLEFQAVVSLTHFYDSALLRPKTDIK